MEWVPSFSVRRVEFSESLGSGSLRWPWIVVVWGVEADAECHDSIVKRLTMMNVTKDIILSDVTRGFKVQHSTAGDRRGSSRRW